ncbi:MAG TPA: SpoIIE family protein phosphatase [Leptospiraceae bacterium]|nr:SpoIIE family protein phosphatase [Leptospiraceae bacterium]
MCAKYKSFYYFICSLLLFSSISIGSDENKTLNDNSILARKINLDSESDWEYSLDDITDPTQFESNLNSTHWKKYKVPSNLNSIEINSKQRIWIKRKIILPENLSNKHLSIRLGSISDRDRTYFNGVLIGSTGCFGCDSPQAYDKVRIYDIPNNLTQKENILLIQVERFFPEEIGINQDYTAIGITSYLEYDRYKEDLFKLILLSIYGTVGCYFLFLYIRRRQEVENLYFSSFVFTVIVYQFLRTQIKYQLNLDFVILKKIEYMFFASLIPLFSNFIRVYFKIKISRFVYLLNLFSLFSIGFYLLSSNLVLFDLYNKRLTQPIGFLYIGFLFYYLLNAFRSKNRDAVYFLSGVVLIFISVVTDILSDRGYFQFPRTFGYSFMFFVLSIAITLANKFVRLHSEVEELNTSLEQKVKDRTKELNESMEEIKQIKTQQDGDYFLTSLLLTPLTSNRNQSEYVKTQFFSKQKKSFHFKNKTYEIGGDISISANITLNDKLYTVFINGDAMGKSIQGAGGALVMGVVFNTVLSRSQVGSFKTKTPEKWLKDAFLELQRIFESFDGTMFLSCAMGLIDEEAGFLYYLNAEHPWTILYRDGKARFIEENFTTRKLGIFENDKLFSVKTMKLLPGDVLILGSDGRDDIQIGIKDDIRIINEDENLFLDIVQKGNGKLADIVELLHKTGELTDDCSLVRVEYLGMPVNGKVNFTEILSRLFKSHYDMRNENMEDNVHLLRSVYKLHPSNEVVNRQLSFHYFKKRDFHTAIKHINQYTYKKPESTDMFYLASVLNKKCGNYEKAIDIGEQILLRDPKNFRNLKNLKELYHITQKMDRVDELERRIKELKNEVFRVKS